TMFQINQQCKIYQPTLGGRVSDQQLCLVDCLSLLEEMGEVGQNWVRTRQQALYLEAKSRCRGSGSRWCRSHYSVLRCGL
uniref:Uncharacterized protein n=1 Tax=Melopsittacus undulatus TaxID=13146 RepID=A0A8V5FN40_MELUD